MLVDALGRIYTTWLIHFCYIKMFITQPRSKKKTSQMEPGEAVWGKNRLQKIS